MTFMNWILGKKAAHVADHSPKVNQELFIETTAPGETKAPTNGHQILPEPSVQRERRSNQRPTAVHNFLEKDYWQQGYNHAIQFPTNDRKQSALVRIRADYRQALQQAEQLLFSEKESHEQELLRMAGISDVLDAQLQRRSKELQTLLGQISSQLELSVDDEGWVAPVLAAYNDGFVVGAMEYMRNNDLLGGVTGLK